MEPLTFTRTPTPSYDPQSSKKRTFSPDAPTTRTKKPKTEPGHDQSDKDRRRRRRRKQKKQPIARDSGAHNLGAVLGDAQNIPSSSLTPASPLPSVSRSAETRLSLASSQSDRPFDSSSAPPPLDLSPGSSSHEQRAACASLQSERVIPVSHSESKVRLLSEFVSNCVRAHLSLSTTTKHSSRALYPLFCAKSVSICSTNPLHFPHAGMSPVITVSSIGSTLISNLMDWKVEAFSAKKHVLIAVQ
jgi:hypothetical protein